MPNITLFIPGFSIQHHQHQSPSATTVTAMRGKTQPREKPRQQKKWETRAWDGAVINHHAHPNHHQCHNDTHWHSPDHQRAAGSGLQPWWHHTSWERGGPHLCERSGHSSAEFPMEEEKGGSVSDKHPGSSAPWYQQGGVGTRLVHWCFDPKIEGVCR